MSIVTDIKKIPLNEEHKKLGGKMINFAGWEMPVQYSSVIQEHNTVRNKAGLFDVSHMGQVFVSGNDSEAFLQKLVPQDISKLHLEKAVYTQLTNHDAGIIDDLIIYKLENSKYLLIINASRIEEDVKWLSEAGGSYSFTIKCSNNETNSLLSGSCHRSGDAQASVMQGFHSFLPLSELKNSKDFDVVVDNQSDNLSMLALQGPNAADILEKMGLRKENQPKRFFIKETNLLDTDIFVAATGYTGEDGFEIIIPNQKAAEFWQNILSVGEEFGLKPIGLAARDTLRLEAALMLYGQDMDENTTPVEASLAWTVSRDKKEDYFGKDKILSQINNKNEAKKLVGFKMLDKSIPRHNYIIYADNAEAGVVTSGGVGAYIEENIGLGYINAGYPTEVGTKIEIMIREKLHPAQIVKRPFYKKHNN